MPQPFDRADALAPAEIAAFVRSLSQEEAQARIDWLTPELARHNRLYH